MKVTVADFSNALSLFEAKWLQTLNSNANKFFAGVALARANAGLADMVKPFTGADGMVDVDALKAAVDAGLAAADGKLVLTPKIDPRLKLVGIGIDEVRFTRADFDDFFDTTVAQFAK